MSGIAALSVDGLRVQFAGDGTLVQAVRGVSFSVQAGETVAVVGESGSGKTVTALAVMGLIERPGVITDGDIRLAGRPLVGIEERQ
jgi:ABC-type glutathione transport system ATPase component